MNEEEFDERIRFEGECEIWTRAFDNNGYPVFNDNGSKRTAHRYAYEREYGTCPNMLRNLCGNRKCVNPQHYEPGRKSREFPSGVNLSLKERLDRKTIEDGECRVWTGVLDTRSRGRIWLDGQMRQAHRVAWVLEYKYEPDWLYRKPECRFRECVNPHHYKERKIT